MFFLCRATGDGFIDDNLLATTDLIFSVITVMGGDGLSLKRFKMLPLNRVCCVNHSGWIGAIFKRKLSCLSCFLNVDHNGLDGQPC